MRLALLVVAVVVLATLAAATPNPHNRKHSVSRSSFHTDQGRTFDHHKAYKGQGQSHIANAMKPSKFGLEHGQHLGDPDVYASMQTLVKSVLGSSEDLPSLEAAVSAAPEQVKISITQRDGELVVNWLTWNVSSSPQVKYGTSSGNYNAMGKADTVTFIDPNTFHLVRYIHNALLTNLPPGTVLYYRVGDADSQTWSDELTLTTPGNGTELHTVVVFGDLGTVNAQSMQKINDEVVAGDVDLILHLGDYAYNMDELEGITGDVFLKQMQNMTSRVPYMGAPGNHEHAFNFSHYGNRFSLYNYIADPTGQPDQNWWYSWDFTSGGSRTHYISFSSELYFYNFYATSPAQANEFARMIETQWKWIVADLTAAYDSRKYDWIVAYAHRPMYCSNVDDMPDCSTDAAKLRKGIPTGPGGTLQWGIEEALAVRPLDLFLCAHEHSYERTLPVGRNGSIDFQADLNRYEHPTYPTHIVTGSAGCREYLEHYDEVFYGPWSVFRSSTYGYGRLTAHNATHLHWEQLIDEGNGGTDQLWIVKRARGDQEALEGLEGEEGEEGLEEQGTPLFDDQQPGAEQIALS